MVAPDPSAIRNSQSTISIAVVGAGYWGPNLIRIFSSLPESRLATVCDLDMARLTAVTEKYPNVRTTAHLADVLSDPSIEAVVIATPAESHRSIAEACLKAGKHVFVEKPIAACSEDARAMLQMAEEAQKTLMVGHIFLYDPAVANLIHLTQSGDIGDVRYAYGIRTSMGGTARLDTNIIWDALVHDAYILPALIGKPPRRVMAVGSGYLMPGLEDVAFVTFDFGDNTLAQIYVSWYALEKSRKITVIGSDAILHYDDLAPSKLTLFARRYEQSPERDPQGRPRWFWKDEGGQPIGMPKAEPLRAECQHFIECILTGKRPMTDARTGLESVQVLEACQESLQKKNTWIEVKHE